MRAGRLHHALLVLFLASLALSPALFSPSHVLSSSGPGVAPTVLETPQPGNGHKPFDFDADGKADASVWQSQTTHNWLIIKSSNNQMQTQLDWGSAALNDVAVPGDYDGDGKTDCAVWRPSDGIWYIVQSSTGTPVLKSWGLGGLGDKPVPGDYDGDGKTDVAVYRAGEGNWYIQRSSDNVLVIRNWGASTDELVPADYDGDGKTDVAVYRPAEGNWYILKSTTGTLLVQWGGYGDKLVPADYDGDGRADIAVWRPAEGNWYIKRSSDGGVTLRGWGGSNDVPVAADYDGDNKTDIAVWRPSEGNWYIIQSSNGGVMMPNIGASLDFSVPSAYVKTVVPPPNQPPTANAGGPYTAIPSVSLQFDGSHSTDADGIIIGYQWNFGDGTTGTGARPKHAYATSGTKTVTLTVTDDRSGTSTATVNVNVLSSEQADFANALLDPMNRVGDSGENPLSRNFNWTLSLLQLRGRAGLDLGLTLSYNSLLWTRAGNYIAFDLDNGYPGPGFRLGFPIIQRKYHNSRTGKDSYRMIMPSGSRVELRQVGNTNGYVSADSSYLQLIDNGGLLVRTPDGTQLSYVLLGDEYQCTEVKDKDGNFITIAYSGGRLSTVTDTLGRIVSFNHNADGYLTSITQQWMVNGQQQTHTWARFTYSNPDLTIGTNFSGLTVLGPQNNTTLRVLTEVKLGDNSSYKFLYSPYGQVYRITHYAADNHPLAYRRYDLDSPGAQDDVPRFTARYDWAEDWNDNQEVATSFAVPVAASWTLPDNTSQTGLVSQITTPDGTVQKVFSPSTGWDKGLEARTETWAAGALRRWTATSWTQDDVALAYPLNPRPVEVNVGDPEGNRRRTTVTYSSFSLPGGSVCHLPKDVKEYSSDATTVLRYRRMEYNMATAYTDRWLIGLVSKEYLYTGGDQLLSKIELLYDQPGSVQDQGPTVQHDPAYGANSLQGRGLVTAERSWDVNSPDELSSALTSYLVYNTAGAVITIRDPLWQEGHPGHQISISYGDWFSDGNNARNTFAYPTLVTDADGSPSTSQYNFDFGAVTRMQTPPPQGFSEGPVQTVEYDPEGRISRVNTLLNNSIYRYTRLEYPASQIVLNAYSTVQDGAGEARSISVFDGAGRIRAEASELPNSTGGYTGRLFVYDIMGRLWKQSNPAETNASGQTWTTTGEDAGNWQYTTQSYDWKSRPLITTNPNGTTVEAAYGGCGCAGGEIITLKDEIGRRQRVTTDILGRLWKRESLNPDQSVYSTVTNNYNARDQVTSVVEQDGASGVSQTTTLTYDGHGRLKTQQTPAQTAPTLYAYNADGTIAQTTDARGVAASFTYNNRRQVTSITYNGLAGIPATQPVTFSYDAAGNRTGIVDSAGSVSYTYDQLSRVTTEARQFNGLSGTYTLSYGYGLSNQLASVTDPTGSQVSYSHDKTGRVTAITGTAFAGVTQYAANIQYRAWGALKNMTSGDGKTTEVYYNSLMQPTDFYVQTSNSGLILKHYDYNPDGTLRYSHDQMDSRFDRSYVYDHMGRVKSAFSGPLASGQTDTNNRPYKLDYAYDALNHLLFRGGKMWSVPNVANTGSAAYVNNRNTGWQYDADGRLLDTTDAQYIFDAAGRPVSIISDSGDLTQAQTFDGDGQRTKVFSQRTIHNEDGTTTTETTTQYFITSSVLDAVVTELDQAGQKTRTFVYRNGEILAWQQKGAGAETMAWEHRDLSNASIRIPGAADGANTAELEPLGSDAGTLNPVLFPPQHHHGEDLTYPGMADLFNGRCKLNGIAAPCSIVDSMLHNGSGYVREPGESITARLPKPKKPAEPGEKPHLKPYKEDAPAVPTSKKVTTTVENQGGRVTINWAVTDNEGTESEAHSLDLNQLLPHLGPQQTDKVRDLLIHISRDLLLSQYEAIVNNRRDVQSLELILCHAAQESGFLRIQNLDGTVQGVEGPDGDLGLFQIQFPTAQQAAARLGLSPITREQVRDNDALNTQLATDTLQYLINRFDGNVRNALGAYKQGYTGVRRKGLSRSSQNYADQILECERRLQSIK